MSMSTVPVDMATAPSEKRKLDRGRKHAPNVVFFGIFGIHNLGNECTLQAIVHNARLRIEDGQFRAISFDPDDTFRRHNLAAFPMSYQDFSKARPGLLTKIGRILFLRLPGELMDWLRAIKAMRGNDLVVMTGTGMLTDYSTTAFGFPYHVFRWALASRIAGCKVRFVGVGVGPIYQSLSRKFISWALKAADYRGFRDEFSRNRIKAVFDSSHDYVFPDLAFSLPDDIFPVRQKRSREKLRIGLGIMDHRDVHLMTHDEQESSYSAYLEKMCEFVEWLVAHGYEVQILQGDAKHDVASRADLKARLKKGGILYEQSGIFDEGSSNVEELLSQLAKADIIVSPRFHNLLLGAMMNIPSISISYDPKSDALLEGLGLGKYRQALFELDVKLLIQHFIELEEKIQEIRPQMSEKVAENRRLLAEQYDIIFGDL
jgi:polysaccharide pyruvyl transferase WcaK-like protein